jgi:Arc/MetJ family transcription regulator
MHSHPKVYRLSGTVGFMSSVTPRIQVTLDAELAAAVAEFGGTEPRSRAVRDLAVRGAEAIRAERADRRDAQEHLMRIAAGDDDGYDFTVSEQLHASR